MPVLFFYPADGHRTWRVVCAWVLSYFPASICDGAIGSGGAGPRPRVRCTDLFGATGMKRFVTRWKQSS